MADLKDVEVFSVGTWNGDKYTLEHLQAFVAAFNELKETVKPPLKLGHNKEQMKEVMKDGHPSLGWVSELKEKGGKLLATFKEVPDVVREAIKKGLYKRVSIEAVWNLKHKGETFKRVLTAVALLGADIPAVSNLKDLEAFLSQSFPDMGTAEKVRIYSFDTDGDGALKIEAEQKPKTGDQDDMPKTYTEDEVKGYKDDLDTQKKENKKLQDQADQDATDLKEFKAKEAKKDKGAKAEELKQFCEDSVKAGVMTPAGRTIIVKALDEDKHSYSEDSGFEISFETFKLFSETIGKVLPKDEKGEHKGDDKDDKEYSSVQDEVNQKAKAYMDESKKEVTYSDAIIHVLESDDELAGKYNSNFGTVDNEGGDD